MPDEVGPESLSTKGIPAARRGLDRRVVDRIMAEAAANWSRLRADHDALLDDIEAAGGLEFFKSDLAALADEIGQLLTDAQIAAEGIRNRAADDAQIRAQQADEHGRHVEAEADQVAFTIRRQAWEEGTHLLDQVQQTVYAMLEQADADVLIIRAEAEQEAHRRVAAARREGSDIVRNARFEADRLVTEAKAVSSDLTASAKQEAEAAQQRTKALEGRRRKLLEQMDEERHGSGDAGIRVIPPKEEAPRANQLGSRRATPATNPLADDLAAEVEEMQGVARRAAMEERTVPSFEPLAPEPDPEPEVEAEPVSEPEPAPVPDPEPVADDETEATPEPEPVSESEDGAEVVAPEAEEPPVEAETGVTEDAGDDLPDPDGDSSVDDSGKTADPDAVSGLFARLRGGDDEPEPDPVTDGEPVPVPAADADPIEVRDRHLLAITNRGLREVKQAIVEVQNVVLDAFRVSGSWEPDREALADQFGAATDGMVEEAASAGANAAAEMAGGVAPAPVITIRSAGMTGAMLEDLLTHVEQGSAVASGAGPREASAAVSRVFRGWRGEDAERWVGAIAATAYHDSLLAGLASLDVSQVVGVRHGRPCDTCPASSGKPWDPAAAPPDGTDRPPASVDCHCTVAPLR